MTIVQSLWIGDSLSSIEIYSIKSFLRLGMQFHLYTYGDVEGIPEGTLVLDANEIMDKSDIFTLKDASLLPFSDIWRYKLLYDKGGYWVDLDFIATKVFDFEEPYVFASERTIQKGAYASKAKSVYQICILKAPIGSPFFKELYHKCIMKQERYGVNNKDKTKYMRVFRDLVHDYQFEHYVKSPETFCNLDWWYAKDCFLPKETYVMKYGVEPKPIDSMFENYGIHLWRNLLTNKYRLDVEKGYDERSLWEKIKKFVDGEID